MDAAGRGKVCMVWHTVSGTLKAVSVGVLRRCSQNVSSSRHRSSRTITRRAANLRKFRTTCAPSYDSGFPPSRPYIIYTSSYARDGGRTASRAISRIQHSSRYARDGGRTPWRAWRAARHVTSNIERGFLVDNQWCWW